MKRVPFWDPLMFNDEQRQPLPPHGFPLRSLERFWTSLNLCTSWSWFLKIIFALGQKWWHYLTGHTHAVNLRQPWTTIRSWQDMHWQKYKHYTQLAYTLSLWKRLNGYLLDGKYESTITLSRIASVQWHWDVKTTFLPAHTMQLKVPLCYTLFLAHVKWMM